MMLSEEIAETAVETQSPRRQFPGSFVQQHIDKILVAILACVTAITRIWNLTGYPRWFSDEGVYVSQAWAIQYLGKLAPYTYWYDHPPVGWMQLSGWSVLTGALRRHEGESIIAGREFMVILAVASVCLTYVLARRLTIRRAFSVGAGLLYALSPLAVSFSRYVLLDNIAIFWLLAAMVLALSPTRRISAAAASGLCLGMAILSKETATLVAFAVLYLIWHNYRDSDNRGYAYIVFGAAVGCFGFLYPLFATLNGELVPGADHVSLWQGQVMFQLSSRQGSGSILDPQSNSRQLVNNVWLGLDPWLPIIGVAAILPALFVRKLRAPLIALGVQVAWTFKGGYLPYPFIITFLPFMVLLIAGLADTWWPTLDMIRERGTKLTRASVGALAVVILMISFVVEVLPNWTTKLGSEFTATETADQKKVLNWVAQNLPQHVRIVTEGELWLDIRRLGYDSPEVIWTYKIDTDPAVKQDYGGIAGLDYLVLNQSTIDESQNSYQTIFKASQGAKVLTSFGDGPNKIVVLQVTGDH